MFGSFRRAPSRLLLTGMAVTFFAAAGFVALGSEVSAGHTQWVDERVLYALRDASDPLRPRGSGWLRETALDVTALGSTAVLVVVSAAVIGFTVLGGDRRLAALMLLAALGGVFLDERLKDAYDRPRPPPAYGLGVRSASFPSGHALGAAAVYLSLAAVLSLRQRLRRRKAYVLAVALTVTALVGLSRVYLGVHYPTDVLGGWLAGLAWAVLCALVTRATRTDGGPRVVTEAS